MKHNVKMKCLTVLIFWITFSKWTSAQTCIPEHSNMLGNVTFVNDVIDDDFRGNLVTFTVTGITAANVVNTDFADVDVSVEVQTVSVFLTDEFENYEAKTISEGVPQIRFLIELTCGATLHTVNFQQRITDINNNAPEFLQTEYRYRIPMPFPSQIEITQFGKELIARDIDITNNDITLDVVGSDYFNFASEGTVDDLYKDYKFTMVALRPLEFSTTQTFTLRATDSGIPSLSSEISLIIEVDEDNSAASAPLFSEAYYEVNYENLLNAEENPFKMSISDGELATYSFSLYEDNIKYRYENGELLVWLINGFEDEDLEMEGSRQIVITATASVLKFTRTVLNVILPVGNTPAFSEAYYEVNYENLLNAEENPFKMSISDGELATYSFSLYEDNIKYSYENGELLVWLINGFEDEDLEMEGSRQIVITATASALKFTRTVLNVILPVGNTPVFNEAYYEVNYENLLNAEENPFKMSISDGELATYSFSLYEDNIKYSYKNGELLVWLFNGFDDEDLEMEGSRQIVITATASALKFTRTVLNVILPVGNTPVFSEAYYEVNYENLLNAEENPFKMSISDGELATYSFSLYEDNIKHSYDNGELLVWLIKGFEDEDLEKEGSRQIVITATVSALKLTRTVLNVILPVITPDAAITFEGAPFKFTLTSSETLASVDIPLTATSSIDEKIIYSSTDIPNELFSLDSATAILRNRETLESGIYEFNIIARGETSRVAETASVTIVVTALEICNGEPVMRYSHFLKYQMENEASPILPLTIETEEELNLKYEIVEVSPVEGQDLFYIRDGILYCNELDREADHFVGMEVAQYIITAKVSVEEEEEEATRNYRNSIFNTYNKNAYASTRAEDTCQCATVGSIETQTFQTQITVVVLDANDNYPVFSPSSMVNGYPARSLLSTITPSSILQVYATDADFGENAQLSYYVDNSYVTIHPTTGVIYPTDAFPDNDFSFTVTARDQNGNGLESSNELQIEIKILGQEHISVLTVKNHLIEDADDKVSEFNELGNVNIRILQSSVIPSQTTSETASQTAKQTRVDEDYYLVITAYAFDANQNLITSDSLRELLGDVDDLSINTLPDATPDCDEECDCDDCDPDNCEVCKDCENCEVCKDCENCEVCEDCENCEDCEDCKNCEDSKECVDCDDCECNTDGFIISVSILSVLLFLLIVGFVVFYYFKIRKSKSYDQMEEEYDRISTPPQFAKNITMARRSSELSQVSDKPEKGPAGIIFATPGDSNDHCAPPISSPKERKSVAFNANVEQINIVTTHDDDIESSNM